ncbi:MAG: hypothetical protein HYY13_07065 [Nitrospirae bacterium]|nr:hypothetical protein [Nitrospirota bacterium]
MAWATAMVSFADGSEDLLSRQAFNGNFLNRFEIIPNDGLGFTPGQTITLQMLDRSAPIRGFPFPPSSVSLDGQALSSPYLNDEITIAPSRILRIEDLAGNLLADTFPNSTPVVITTPPPFRIITENAGMYGLLARSPGEIALYNPLAKVAPNPDDGVDSFILGAGTDNVYFGQPGTQWGSGIPIGLLAGRA